MNGQQRALMALGIGLMLVAVVGAAGVLARLLLGGIAPAPGAGPATAAVALPEANPSPVGPATAPALLVPPDGSAWPLVLEDTFTNEAYAWERGDFTGSYGDARLEVADGRYWITVDAREGLIWWSLVDPEQTSAGTYIEVEAEKLAEAAGDYGLVFRWDGENYYYFQVDPDDTTFTLSLYHNGGWETLVEWTASPAIQAQGANRLAVTADGPRLGLFINGAAVAAVEDARLPRGAVGVAMQVYQGGQTARNAFDNFRWRAPAGDVQPAPR